VILMPIVYVTDMERSIEFYRSLGFTPLHESAHWSELGAGDGARLALHLADGSGLELALTSTDALESVAAAHADDLARGIADEAFGRSLVLRDPDGLRLQVNEHD
jgi:catechol 2,3-dioxygenase-like lactoylglutathione lyase family enzyme